MWNSFGQMAPDPGSLFLPRDYDAAVANGLRALGHKVRGRSRYP